MPSVRIIDRKNLPKPPVLPWGARPHHSVNAGSPSFVERLTHHGSTQSEVPHLSAEHILGVQGKRNNIVTLLQDIRVKAGHASFEQSFTGLNGIKVAALGLVGLETGDGGRVGFPELTFYPVPGLK